jgi:hypothetical protein
VAEPTGRGVVFWAGLTLGAGVVAYGLIGAWTDRADTHPVELAAWLGAAGVVHDALVAPVFVAVAVLTGRLAAWARTPVRLALAVTALLTVLAWPLVRGWGQVASDPSVLPLDYGRNLALVVATIWALTGAVLVLRWRRVSRVD